MKVADYPERAALPRLQVLWEWTSKSVARRCHASCSLRLPQGGSARSSLMRFNIASFRRNVSAVRHSKYCGYVKHSLWAFCCSVRSHLTYMLILWCSCVGSSRAADLTLEICTFTQLLPKLSFQPLSPTMAFNFNQILNCVNDVRRRGHIIDKYIKYDRPIWHGWRLLCASVQGCVVKGVSL